MLFLFASPPTHNTLQTKADMDNKKQTLNELEALPEQSTGKKSIGWNRRIRRQDRTSGRPTQRPGDQFAAIPTVAEFGARISSASGKSANIEFAPVVRQSWEGTAQSWPMRNPRSE